MTLTPQQARVRLNAVQHHLDTAAKVANGYVDIATIKAIQELKDFLDAALVDQPPSTSTWRFH